MDILNYAANLLLGSIPEPIDWEAKRRNDEQRVRREQARAALSHEGK